MGRGSDMPEAHTQQKLAQVTPLPPGLGCHTSPVALGDGATSRNATRRHLILKKIEARKKAK